MEVRRSSLLFTRNAVVTMVLRDVSQNLTKRKSVPWRVVEAELVTFPIPVTECLMEAMKEKGLNLAHRSGKFQSRTVGQLHLWCGILKLSFPTSWLTRKQGTGLEAELSCRPQNHP